MIDDTEHRDGAPAAENPPPIPGPAPGERYGELAPIDETDSVEHIEPESVPSAAAEAYPSTPGAHNLLSPPHPATMDPESAKGVLRNLWAMFSDFALKYEHPLDGQLGDAVAHAKFVCGRNPTP